MRMRMMMMMMVVMVGYDYEWTTGLWQLLLPLVQTGEVERR